MSKATYNELFRELFPKEWQEFIKKKVREKGMTLRQVFAEDGAEFARATNDAPPLETFCDLMERRYFPLPDIWLEWEDVMEEGETLSFAFSEIPLMPFFQSYEFDEDAHRLWPVCQLIKTLGGETLQHITTVENEGQSVRLDSIPDCGERCPLRALFALACNDLFKVNLTSLERLCRKEKSPLRHLALACRIMNKETGNAWFDYDDELYGGETGIEWNMGNVHGLKRQYDEANKLMKQWSELNDWLRQNMLRAREAGALWRRAARLF